MSLVHMIALILLAASVVMAVANRDFQNPLLYAVWSAVVFIVLSGVV